MSYIFISYSKQDIEFARYLRALLESEGCAVWMDEERLQPSARWWKEIEDNITTCAAFVVIMSPHAEQSDWVEREILLAEKLKRPLFPVLLAGESWSRLANIQYEDLRAGLRAKPSARFMRGLQDKLGTTSASRAITLEMSHGDITKTEGDVIALKFSSSHNGAAASVAHRLTTHAGVRIEDISPPRGKYGLVASGGTLGAPQVMYVGTAQLRHFGYDAVRELGQSALRGLALYAPQTRHLLMTINGPGTSLDENEATLYQVRGYLDALDAGEVPPALQRITLVERDAGRLARIRSYIDEQALTSAEFSPRWQATNEDGVYRLLMAQAQGDAPRKTARKLDIKPHAFIAMPQAVDLEDAFFYGIQSPIHAHGLLCERIEDALTDELLDQAKERIMNARVVVADLTDDDPLVYLQIGVAWGSGRPVILIRQERDGGQSALRHSAHLYGNIKALESVIRQALDAVLV
jgi:hypothetical protein